MTNHVLLLHNTYTTKMNNYTTVKNGPLQQTIQFEDMFCFLVVSENIHDILEISWTYAWPQAQAG